MIPSTWNVLNLSSKIRVNRCSGSFPSLILAKNGRIGKWSRPSNFTPNNGGSSNSSGNFGNFSGGSGDGYDGSKPRSSSELLFFSTGKSFASYPLDQQVLNPKNVMMDALKTMMKPWEVKGGD